METTLTILQYYVDKKAQMVNQDYDNLIKSSLFFRYEGVDVEHFQCLCDTIKEKISMIKLSKSYGTYVEMKRRESERAQEAQLAYSHAISLYQEGCQEKRVYEQACSARDEGQIAYYGEVKYLRHPKGSDGALLPTGEEKIRNALGQLQILAGRGNQDAARLCDEYEDYKKQQSACLIS